MSSVIASVACCLDGISWFIGLETQVETMINFLISQAFNKQNHWTCSVHCSLSLEPQDVVSAPLPEGIMPRVHCHPMPSMFFFRLYEFKSSFQISSVHFLIDNRPSHCSLESYLYASQIDHWGHVSEMQSSFLPTEMYIHVYGPLAVAGATSAVWLPSHVYLETFCFVYGALFCLPVSDGESCNL